MLGLTLALVTGSAVEYATHRLLHGPLKNTRMGRAHMAHHQTNVGQGLWGDLKDYAAFAVVLGPPGFLMGWQFGLEWCLGACLYVVFVAVAHNLAHRGIGFGFHGRHHKRPSGNFGVVTPVWDWLCGTRDEARLSRRAVIVGQLPVRGPVAEVAAGRPAEKPAT